MKVKRGQCRFCPVVIPKFGALIKHEAEHLAKLKQLREVEENGSKEVNFKDVKLFESEANVSTPSVCNGNYPEPVKGPSEDPLPPQRSPKSVSTLVNPPEANEIIPKIEPPMEGDNLNAIGSSVISSGSAAARDFDGLEDKIRERRISEYRIWKEMGQFDWRSEFVKIKGPGNVYQCLLCHGQFKKVNPSTFKLHQMGHTGETPYSTFCCSKKFTRYENRNKHEKVHLKRLGIALSWGSKNEKRSRNGRKIVAKRPEDEEVTERIRNYDWSQDWSRIKVPGSVMGFKCNHCGHNSVGKSQLLLHIFIHTGEKEYKCRFCSFSSRLSTSRDNHERIHTGERPFKCPKCPKAFAQRSSHYLHVKLHKKQNYRPRNPNKSQKTLISDTSTPPPTDDTPPSIDHLGPKAEPSHISNISKSSPKKLKLAQDSNPTQFSMNKIRMNSICKSSSTSSKDGKTKRKWNGREIVAKRPEDEEVTERIRNYDWTKDWIRNKVPGSVRTFKCIQCGYVCAAKCNLLIHVFVHTGETPYKCRFCSFSSRSYSSRDNHERVHTGDGTQKRIYTKKSDLMPSPAPPPSIYRLRTRVEPQNLNPTQSSMTLEESKCVKVTLKRVESDAGVSTLLKEAQERLKAMKHEEIERKCPTPASIQVKCENPINFFNENEPEIEFQVQREYPNTDNVSKKVPILNLVRIDQNPRILKAYPRAFGLETPSEKSLNPRNGEIQFNEEDLLELEEAMNDLTNCPVIN